MPKVNTKSLRSLASKVKPSILTGAITESAEYIDELEKEVEKYKTVLNHIAYGEINGWSGSDVLGKVRDLAAKTITE